MVSGRLKEGQKKRGRQLGNLLKQSTVRVFEGASAKGDFLVGKLAKKTRGWLNGNCNRIRSGSIREMSLRHAVVENQVHAESKWSPRLD